VAEKLDCNHHTDGVAPEILRAGTAASVAEEPGQWICATRLQLVAEDVSLCHAHSITHGGARGVCGPLLVAGQRPVRGA